MTLSSSRVRPRARVTAAALGLLTATLVPGLVQLPAFANGPTPAAAIASAAPADDLVITPGDPAAGLADLDVRGVTKPSAAQIRAVSKLGVNDVRWNDFGTPASLLPKRGSLGRATSSDPAVAARAWLRSHAAVFGLSTAQIDSLELVNVQQFAQSSARAVLFRQRFGSLVASIGSMVTVGVAGGHIAYVSSSLTKTTGSPAEAALSPLQGWLKAADNVGRPVPAGQVGDIETRVANGFTQLTVPGFAQEQQARLRALAFADGSVRPVIEANVVDVSGGSTLAYTLMVDAVSGAVLHRHNQVDNADGIAPFTGSTSAQGCGPLHPFTLTDDATKEIVAVSVGAPVDDHVVKLFDPNGNLLVAGDLGTNPEAATYQSTNIPAGTYNAQVCPFDDPTVPANVGPYEITVGWSSTAGPSPSNVMLNPKWRYFTANPSLGSLGSAAVPGNSNVGCWLPAAGCDVPTGALRNVSAPGPWDTISAGGTSTQTTSGNNANTKEAWASPLTPGGLFQAPVSALREYTQAFTDAWDNAKCSPSALVPGGNDIVASVTNLFASHNRMHDYSYYLGFTESNYNMQVDNLGRGGVGGDPEVGNAQAGALTGGNPSYLGRDNANQITLQDGTPGITNQYLFQPIAGAFYSPCADGGLDMSIVGHEYTHAISNRMVGGPDEGLTSEHGGAMGESWSDLVAAEYMFSHGYSTGASPWVVGPYATGNTKAGIRDYPIDKNPLNFSDYGFDSTGDEVHADGEIWNAAMWEVRQALVEKYNKAFPYSDAALQLKCAQASTDGTSSPFPAQACPGNRRWVQLVFDAFLLQQGATSMLDARDAMIAADQMRFNGANANVLYQAFARRGMGKRASVPSADSGDTVPSFASARGRNVRVKFVGKGKGKVYVGPYEARATPVADLDKKTALKNKTQFTPGKYRMTYVSPKTGFKRFTLKVTGKKGTKGKFRIVKKIKTKKNFAAAASGAKVLDSTAGSRNPDNLIDGTEATNWGGVTEGDVDTTHPSVTVDLAGKRKVKINRIQVSAMLNPAPANPEEIPLAADPDSGSRFTALRQFALEVCVKACTTASAKWRRVYVSRADAFPAIAPRPVAPNLTLRTFKLKKAAKAVAVRLVTLENQCTGGPAYAGEQDEDPTAATDCKAGSDRGTIVHAAELQVFGKVVKKKR
ncbi:M36 family metallopeptidase [Nocardioides dilutus]